MTIKFHVLGLGGVGKLIASCLPAGYLCPSVTLLLHRPGLAAQWHQNGGRIEVTTKDYTATQTKLAIEEIHPEPTPDTSNIENLIVATKTQTTVAALAPLRSRLTPDSTLIFLQNGMGTIDEVNDELFPVQSTRPQYISGIVNHGVIGTGPFSVIHSAPYDMTLGRAPRRDQVVGPGPLDAKTEAVLDCFRSAPVLNAKSASRNRILFLQLQKLAVNAVINPLTSIVRCRNGELYGRLSNSRLIPDLVAEIASIIQPYVSRSSGWEMNDDLVTLLSAENLEQVVANAAKKTAENTSSMRQDMLAGKQTEIDYINGWIVARAEEAGRPCPLNAKIVEMIKNREGVSAEQLVQRLCGP